MIQEVVRDSLAFDRDQSMAPVRPSSSPGGKSWLATVVILACG